MRFDSAMLDDRLYKRDKQRDGSDTVWWAE